MNFLHFFFLFLQLMALIVMVASSRRRAPVSRRRSLPTTRRRKAVVIVVRRRRSCTRRDCRVSNWGDWSECDASCGDGRKSRERTVTQTAFCGGTGCPSLQQTSHCTVTEDRNCVVGQWSPWFSCSTTCGEGERTRVKSIIKQKTCNGLCEDTLSEKKTCSQYVPKDCTLSAWTPWTECSTTCRVPGTQNHSRTVVKEAECNGTCLYALNESRSCAGHQGPWSQWSSCLAGCGRTGSHERHTTLDCGPGIPRLNETDSCTGTCCGKSCNDGLVYAGTYPDCSCKKINHGVVDKGCNAGLIAMVLASLLGITMY